MPLAEDDAGTLWRRLTRYLPYLVILLVVGAVHQLGGLTFIERELDDARFSVVRHQPADNLVLVALDPESLSALGVWPWPRSYHGVVADVLLKAGASRVAFDIDFSSPSISDADRQFASVLEKYPGKIILPIFKQRQSSNNSNKVVLSAPISQFREHALLGSINVRPESDGRVRRMVLRQPWRDGSVPSLAALLAHAEDAEETSFYIDFGIDLEAVRQIPYAAVLAGYADLSDIAGKIILIAPTAIELGDRAPVPNMLSIPGGLLQALAYQSLVTERALQRAPSIAVLGLAAAIALLFSPWLARRTWRTGLLIAGGTSVLLLAMPFAVQAAMPVMFDAVPSALVVLLGFGHSVVKRLDRQTIKLLTQAMTLRRTESFANGVLESSFDGIITFDASGVIESANPAASRLFGRVPESLMGMRITSLLAGDAERTGAPKELVRAFSEPSEALGRRADETTFPLELVVSHVQESDPAHYVGILRDITMRKAQEEALKHQALHDSLTGLPNRLLLQDRLEQSVRTGKRYNRTFALLILDLDRFKNVNDTLGHGVGDHLLIEVGHRLAQPLRESDTMVRLGGDEFAVLLPNSEHVEDAHRVAERLQEALSAPFRFDSLSFEIGASIGIALFPRDGDEAGKLLQNADIAMYNAKKNQTGIGEYDAEQDHHSVRHLAIVGDLRRAIDEGELSLVYQPKVDLAQGTTIGAEALARWTHPEHGFVPPDEFIEVAEETGLIEPLTKWVVETALKQIVAWNKQGFVLAVSINLSAKSLHDESLPILLSEAVKAHGVPHWQLVLEITESAIMVDAGRAMAVLEQLEGMGFSLSIDDFGTGYSSLGYLSRMPVHELKIDRTFVMDMIDDRNNAVIVRSTVDLAHNLGLKVVAEGIETDGHIARLTELGCDVGQGYLISKPMAPEAFGEWLNETTWRPAGQSVAAAE